MKCTMPGCFRQTEQRCGQCSLRVCPRHSWTHVQKGPPIALSELCHDCRDRVLEFDEHADTVKRSAPWRAF